MKKTSLLIIAVLTTWYVLSAVGFYVTLPPTDEGMLLSAARRAGMGEIPYRDFFLYVPPVSIILGALSFQLTGEFFSPRWITISISFATIIIYYKYINLAFGNIHIKVRALMILVYAATAFPITFVYVHHNFTKFIFAILLLLFACNQRNGERHSGDRISIFAGLLILMSGLTNQASGVYYFIGALFIFYKSGGWYRALKFMIPIGAGLFLFFLWLVKYNAVEGFFEDAILWIINNYGKNNTYSVWHEQLYKIENSKNIVEITESVMVLLIKFVILLSPTILYWNRSYTERVLLTLIYLNLATSLQSFNSMNAYYTFSLLFPFLATHKKTGKMLILIMVLMISIQLLRSITYLPRVIFDAQKYGICEINSMKFICGQQVYAIEEIDRKIKDNGIQIHAIIGRSPAMYGILNINNKTIYDQIFPPFVSEKGLEDVRMAIKSKCVLTDFTDKYLFEKRAIEYGTTSERDVSEGLMYDDKMEYIRKAGIFNDINVNLVFNNKYYGISCLQ